MPFVSDRQSRYFFANPGKLGGLKKVREWAAKTNYEHLPETSNSKKPKIGPPRRMKRG